MVLPLVRTVTTDAGIWVLGRILSEQTHLNNPSSSTHTPILNGFSVEREIPAHFSCYSIGSCSTICDLSDTLTDKPPVTNRLTSDVGSSESHNEWVTCLEARGQPPLVHRLGENKGYVCRSDQIGAVRTSKKSGSVKSSPQGE